MRAAAVDAVIFKSGRVLLVRRKFEPFKGWLVLPGGFVDHGETTEDAVVREVEEETGQVVTVSELIGVYSDPARDVRQNISIAYLCELTEDRPLVSSEETDPQWCDLGAVLKLGFDHRIILGDARGVLFRRKQLLGRYSPLATGGS